MQEDHRTIAVGLELCRAPHACRALSAGEPGWLRACTMLTSAYYSPFTCQASLCCTSTDSASRLHATASLTCYARLCCGFLP